MPRICCGACLAVAVVFPFIAPAEEKGVGTPAPIRVAIYDDEGVGSAGPTNLERCLSREQGFATERVTGEDIRGGCLDRFDVVIVPGGSGSKDRKSTRLNSSHEWISRMPSSA